MYVVFFICLSARIYDVESGKIIARFLTGGQFETIRYKCKNQIVKETVGCYQFYCINRLIADKYIMALGFVDNKGQIRAWDLQAAIGSASSKHGTPLFSLPDEIFCPWEIIGDESQVFVFGGVTVTVLYLRKMEACGRFLNYYYFFHAGNARR